MIIFENSAIDYKVEKAQLSWFNNGSEVKTDHQALVVANKEVTLPVSVKDGYNILQNSQLWELADRYAERSGGKIESIARSVDMSRVRIDILEERKSLEYPKRGDVIETGMSLINSHGGGSIKVVNYSLVLSCTNGMTRRIKDKVTNIQHSSLMRDMLEQTLFAGDALRANRMTWFEEIQKMIDTPINPVTIQTMVDHMTGVDIAQVNSDGESEYSSRKTNIVRSLLDSIKEEIDWKGANVWGLLNGFTHYTTHKGSSNKNRETAKNFGSLLSMDEKAYEYALSLC